MNISEEKRNKLLKHFEAQSSGSGVTVYEIRILINEIFDAPPPEHPKPERTRGQIAAEELCAEHHDAGLMPLGWQREIASLIDAERAAMREECAKVALTCRANEIASRIRSIK